MTSSSYYLDCVDSESLRLYICPFIMTVLQTADITSLLLPRDQDPTKLYELGEKGLLPLLVMGGTRDALWKWDVIVEEMNPHFKDFDIVLLEGGGHAVFFENQPETVRMILAFVSKITASVST